MKKLSVLVLALVLLVSVASVSFAATTSYAGEVAITLSQGAFGVDTHKASFTIDLTKSYNDQLSAGVTIGYDSTSEDFPNGLTLGTGWIKFNYSPLVITTKTSIDGNAANALGVLAGTAGGPGVQVDYTVIEGATLTVMGNTDAGFNYLAKGVYSANGLTVGAGYQAGDDTNSVVAAWASVKLGPVTVGGEYANRLTAETTGILGTVAGTFGPVTVNGKFLNKTEGFTNFDGDPDGYSAYDRFQDVVTAGNAIAADATFKATDALSVYGNFQMVLDGEMSYKGGLTYALTDSLKADASYKAIEEASAINVTITDTFVAGLVGSLSLDYDLAAETDATSYTAKVVATL